MDKRCVITLAEEAEYETVDNFLREVDMGVSGDIREHVLMKENDELVAVVKFTPIRADEFHLDTMVVRADKKGQGLGKYLLERLLAAPWECFDGMSSVANFDVTTISRGTAVPFYARFGFVPCALQDIHWVFVDQCEECPAREECDPHPMIYKKREEQA